MVAAQAWSIRDRPGRDGDVILYVGSDTEDDTLSNFVRPLKASAGSATLTIHVNWPSKADSWYAFHLPVKKGKIVSSGIEVVRIVID